MDKGKLYAIYDDQVTERLSDMTIVSEMFNYFSSDDIEGFFKSLNTDYELNIKELE